MGSKAKPTAAPGMVQCPLVDREISVDECVENVDVTDRFIAEQSLPREFKTKSGWREICRACPEYADTTKVEAG